MRTAIFQTLGGAAIPTILGWSSSSFYLARKDKLRKHQPVKLAPDGRRGYVFEDHGEEIRVVDAKLDRCITVKRAEVTPL